MLVLVLVLVLAAALVADCGRPAEVRNIAADRDGGSLRVRTLDDRQDVEVASVKGIGAATLPLARPPRRLRLTFHLRGLEQLRFSYDDVEIVVAVRSSGEVNQTVRRAGAAVRPLRAGDPFWMPVRVERQAGSGPAAPIVSIDVEGPAALREAAPDSCRIDWVDFFR